MDKGPWIVTPNYVGSEDFTRDVALEIHGDFGEGERDKYAQWLADTLNSIPALLAQLALADRLAEAALRNPGWADVEDTATEYLEERRKK